LSSLKEVAVRDGKSGGDEMVPLSPTVWIGIGPAHLWKARAMRAEETRPHKGERLLDVGNEHLTVDAASGVLIISVSVPWLPEPISMEVRPGQWGYFDPPDSTSR
jgi:hypothetical protein